MCIKQKTVFIPRTAGIFVLFVSILAFIAGVIRDEPVLILAGAVFFAVLIYCMTTTFFTALIHRGHSRNFSFRITPREIAAGACASVEFAGNGKYFALPGVLIRCRLFLCTKDGRHITRDFDPVLLNRRSGDMQGRQAETVYARERGAYFSPYDELAVFDALGFFHFARRVYYEADARLLVCPRPAEGAFLPAPHTGETGYAAELRRPRGNTFIDHRPYIPGDDPRRINWKLFGHGRELFVREGEPEPPPRANILILIDTEYDTVLYSADTARKGVDLLCEYALAAALDCSESGMNVLAGFSSVKNISARGQKRDGENKEVSGAGQGSAAAGYLRGNTRSGLAAIFALPFAIPVHTRSAAELPAPPDSRGVLVFALPRSRAETPALSRFLEKKARNGEGGTIEIVFLYQNGKGAVHKAAEACAAFYNQKQGVKARRIGVTEGESLE